MNQADVMPEVMSGSALRLPGTWERPILAHRMTRGSSVHHLKRLGWALDERCNVAGLYSLVGSCIANRVEPAEYLTDVLPACTQT